MAKLATKAQWHTDLARDLIIGWRELARNSDASHASRLARLADQLQTMLDGQGIDDGKPKTVQIKRSDNTPNPAGTPGQAI